MIMVYSLLICLCSRETTADEKKSVKTYPPWPKSCYLEDKQSQSQSQTIAWNYMKVSVDDWRRLIGEEKLDLWYICRPEFEQKNTIP